MEPLIISLVVLLALVAMVIYKVYIKPPRRKHEQLHHPRRK
ncbi:hypothetical protein SAMN05421739_101891 [Pontibacter chinhatensis]|uniref:Uncharacterized protein n=1 Tax=Pontibacter chinhatensis TaxID=1436961 RepID=A0A1I2P295_9BACT|nr:hypothetical protein SAMN05421739_101891 [Pontibacter chinhatensis]